MSNSFEDLKANWQPGQIDDDNAAFEQVLRRRGEVRREEEHSEQLDAQQEREETFEREHSTEEQQSAGQAGGAAGGNGSAGAQPAESSAPEALPQRDEPDDGEHSASTAVDEPEPVEDPEEEDPEVEPDEQDVEEEETYVPEDISDLDEPEEASSAVSGAGERRTDRVKRSGGALPVRAAARDGEASFARGVAFAHSGEGVVLKRFPKELAERLRSLMALSLGEAFASEMSLTQLVAAFVAARLSEPFETDENTEQAMAAFRNDDPRLTTIEDRTGDLLSDVDALRRDLSRMRDTLGEVSLTGEAVQMGVSYLVVDRTLGLNTDGLTPSTIDVDQPKVLEATDNIRRRTKQQRAARVVREGRRLA